MSENNNQSMGDLFPDLGPEVPIISGVAHDNTESLATVRRVPNEPGMAAKVFTLLAEAGVNVDMIVQARASTGTADISSPCRVPPRQGAGCCRRSRTSWATSPSTSTPT